MQIEDRRLWLRILVMGCPLHHAADDCPARDLRLMPPADADKAIAKLTDQQVCALIEYHKICVTRQGAHQAKCC